MELWKFQVFYQQMESRQKKAAFPQLFLYVGVVGVVNNCNIYLCLLFLSSLSTTGPLALGEEAAFQFDLCCFFLAMYFSSTLFPQLDLDI